MKVEVVTVGTELLLGQHPDTNALDLGRALAAAGAELVRRTTVGDRPDEIRAAVGDALARSEFVITTGGLGPTRDDRTKEAVAGLLGRALVAHEPTLAAIEERFRRLGRRPMPAANRRQAEIPEGATVLPNPRGTAPGLWLETGDARVVVMLPGVPPEMRGLLAEEVLPRLARRAGTATVIRSRTVRTAGVAESSLAERVGPLEDGLAPLTLAYLPSPEGVDLRLTAWGLAPAEADARLGEGVERLAAALGVDAYGTDDTDLAGVVLDALRRRRWRLAVAESCTGGLVGQRVTAVPGASDTFVGGVVAYGDDVKRALLDVAPAVLAAHGAVSEPAVVAMVEGARRRFGVEAAVAVTGVAGPSGGTPEKPVGTVWLAASAGDRRRALGRRLPGDRDEVRRRSAQAALDLLRRLLAEP